VVVFSFYRLNLGISISQFIRQQLKRVSIFDILVPMLIQFSIAALAIIFVFRTNGDSLINIKFIQFSKIVPLIIINITSGPMGEELGWRGFALQELKKKQNTFLSSIIIGMVWGLWHFPLWLVSGFSGIDFIVYSSSFMLGIISFSIFISYYYLKTRNIIVAVLIHFTFNILMQLVVLEDTKFILFVSILYLFASLAIVLSNRKMFFNRPSEKISQPTAK
jgi:membrane protease YdiL (CAAX protease family)